MNGGWESLRSKAHPAALVSRPIGHEKEIQLTGSRFPRPRSLKTVLCDDLLCVPVRENGRKDYQSMDHIQIGDELLWDFVFVG